MNAPLSRAAAQATVYTKLGQVLRVPLFAGPGRSPERQLMRWLTRQAMANPGFPLRVKSLLLLVRKPLCPGCSQALYQALHRWNLAGRLRVVVNAQAGPVSPACRCAGRPATGYYGPGADEDPEWPANELEGSYGSADTKTFPLEGAGLKLNGQGWQNGIYVIKRRNTPIYVGKSTRLGTRVQQHALSLTHLRVNLGPYTVQVYHYPAADKPGLKAQEQAHYERLIKRYDLGNAVSPELELAQELNELSLEYEGLFDRFRRLFRQNPVKAALLKGALDASNPLPAKDAALADHMQGITEGYIEEARQRPVLPRGHSAARTAPPSANRLARPAQPNWSAPTSAYGSRLPLPRVKVSSVSPAAPSAR